MGVIFDIQRFCISDGPGIRTVIFFKGCPLRCLWCHNPESLTQVKQLIYRAHKCTGCGLCAAACPNNVHSFGGGTHKVDFDKCRQCGRCVDVCCYGALELLGREMTTAQVIDEIKTDLPYYGADGGVTLSGGEPMLQAEFALALAKAVKAEGISLCMETCGYAPAEAYERIAPSIDLFLYDYKATDEKAHKAFTGVGNEIILKNLGLLDLLGKKIILRCPLIPGVNDSSEHLRGIAQTAQRYKRIQHVEILPYHSLGETKRIQLGEQESLPGVQQVSQSTKERWLSELQALGCRAVLG